MILLKVSLADSHFRQKKKRENLRQNNISLKFV